jgi:hypothetical protein
MRLNRSRILKFCGTLFLSSVALSLETLVNTSIFIQILKFFGPRNYSWNHSFSLSATTMIYIK